MSTREELTRQAEKALRQGRVDEAIAQYQELAYLEPVDWGLVKQLADLLERAGQREAAAKQFARWGDHLFVEGFHSKSAALYKKVLKLEPADEHALWQLAEVSLELKLKADARVAFQRVADLRQRRGDAAGAAVARERLGAIEGATGGPPAAPIRPPAYAPATPAPPVAPPPPETPTAFVRPTRPGIWAGSPVPVAPPPPVEPPPPPPEAPEARLARLRGEAAAADAAQAPDADARWQAVLEADPQDTAVRLRLIRGALDRGDLPAAERLGESLDASDVPALTVLVELAFRRARPDALHRLIAGRVHAGAPPDHVLAPCAALAARHPGAARAVLSAAIGAWTAAGQPGHAVLALEHGESLGILTTAMHLQWVEICVDAGLPGLSRAQRGLSLAYLAEHRLAEARAVAEDLFVREAGEEPHRGLLLEILDRQGHADPHRVLVDLLTPPSETVDETDAVFVVPGPAAPLVPATNDQAEGLQDYGYLPPLRIPHEQDVPSALVRERFLDTGDSSIAVLDIDALLASPALESSPPLPADVPVETAGATEAREHPDPAAEDVVVALPEAGVDPGDHARPSPLASLQQAAVEPESPVPGDSADVAPGLALPDAWPAGPLVPAASAPAPAPSAEAVAFDWASILGRDVDEGPVVASPLPPEAIAPASRLAPPAAPEPSEPTVTVPPIAPVAEPLPTPAPAVVALPAVLRPPVEIAPSQADVAPTGVTPPPAAVPSSEFGALDTSPFARLAELQPAFEDDAPLQPSFAMPSAWLSDQPDAPARPRQRTPDDDYLFAEEVPARWERSRLGTPAPVVISAHDEPRMSPAPVADEPGGLEPAGLPVIEASTALEGPLTEEAAAVDDTGSEDEAATGGTTSGEAGSENLPDAVPLVEEEIDLTQLLEELRQFDTVLPDPAPRGRPDEVLVAAPGPLPMLVPPPAPDLPVRSEMADALSGAADDTHHEDMLPELSPPLPQEGATELDAVFDDLQRHADERSVAEQQLAAGRVFLAAGLVSEAARAFERASLEPRSRFAATLALAELHKSRGQLQDAVSWYEQAAMAPVPDAAVKRPVLYDLAESLEVLGETDRALGVLLDLLSQVEDYRDARARLDRLLRVDAGG